MNPMLKSLMHALANNYFDFACSVKNGAALLNYFYSFNLTDINKSSVLAKVQIYSDKIIIMFYRLNLVQCVCMCYVCM